MNEILQKEIDYINRTNSSFIGQKIKEVFYEELNYESEPECWNYSNNIHSVDMNVLLQIENGKLLQIKWDDEFYCYGIGFAEILEMKIRDGINTINVSENSNWKSLIGKTITSIDIYWDESENQEYQTKLGIMLPKGKKQQFKLPLSWKLNFLNEYVFISAFEVDEDGNNYYWADHLTLFFKEDDYLISCKNNLE